MDVAKPKSSFNPTIAILWFIFYLYILNWLISLDKCKCTNIPEGKHLKHWYTFLIIFELIWFFIYIFINDNQNYVSYMALLLSILGFINIIFLIKTIIYIKKLKDNTCNCGSEFQENVISKIS